MANTFGLVLSSRPMYTEATTISADKLTFSLPSTPPFNHLVVFLLPGAVIPDGQVAAVYLQPSGSGDFTLLGGISSSKPSAIFRTCKVGAGSMGDVDDSAMMEDGDIAQDGGDVSVATQGSVVVGISLEPANQVEQALARIKTSSSQSTCTVLVQTGNTMVSPLTTKLLAQRIIGNAFNFLASFGSDIIPLKAFEEWWKKFERKVELDPSFLERETSS